MADTVQRFNEIKWHDSKLVGVSLFSGRSDERLRLDLMLRRGTDLLSAVLVFQDVWYTEIKFYLGSINVTGHGIDGAACLEKSEWRANIERSHPHDSFSGLLHFWIEMVPEGGTLDLLAADFTLEFPGAAPGTG